MKQRRLNVCKPLTVFEIFFEVKIKKPFALKHVDFYPCCRVLVENNFAFHTQLHFWSPLYPVPTYPVSPHFQHSGKWLVNSWIVFRISVICAGGGLILNERKASISRKRKIAFSMSFSPFNSIVFFLRVKRLTLHGCQYFLSVSTCGHAPVLRQNRNRITLNEHIYHFGSEWIIWAIEVKPTSRQISRCVPNWFAAVHERIQNAFLFVGYVVGAKGFVILPRKRRPRFGVCLFLEQDDISEDCFALGILENRVHKVVVGANFYWTSHDCKFC